MRQEEGAGGRIDLGARLGPVLTACIGVTTRGVQASHVTHRVPATTAQAVRFGYAGGWLGRLLNTFAG